MTDTAYFRTKIIVFALVSASFTNVYLTQPVIPILQEEFSVDLVMVSFSISAIILALALSNLPFRLESDPFNFSTDSITLVFLVYITGILWGQQLAD